MPESNNKYYMSVDGGGSKLSVILFDEEHKIVGRGYSGAINPRFVSDRMIRRNFETGIVDCLKYTGVTHIEKLYIAMPGPVDLFAYMLSKRVKLNQYHYMSEGENSLLGGIFARHGVVALSGTGTGIFHVGGPHGSHMGGWGGLFDDEGSGYSIGRAALNAAVKSYEQRGPPTFLPELIVEKWQLIRFSDVINHVYGSDDYRGLIASLTNLVVETADRDEVCRIILQNAGVEMAQQVIALFERDKIRHDLPVMVAGSVWKGNPHMFFAFNKAVTKAIDGVIVHFPWFEAVIGGAVACLYEKQETLDATAIAKLKNDFQDFRYQVGPEIQSAISTDGGNIVWGPA